MNTVAQFAFLSKLPKWNATRYLHQDFITSKVKCYAWIIPSGTKHPYKPKFGSEPIEKYPNIPNMDKLKWSTCNIQQIPNLQHPITTYKILLPKLNETCNIKFYGDETYGLPYIQSITPTSFIGLQIPTTLHSQQYLISIEIEEPIHVVSAAEEFNRLRKTHAAQIITIQLSKNRNY